MNANDVDFSDVSSVLNLLNGNIYVPWDAPMERPPELPVDPLRIVRAYIYHHPEHQNVFEQALCLLAQGSADKVYLFFDYIDSCLYSELSYSGTTFKINQQRLLPLLRQRLQHYDKELRGAVVFSNGFVKVNPMKTIEETANWYLKNHGLSILTDV